MVKTDSKLLSLWFADGTNYAGQDSISGRKERPGALHEIVGQHRLVLAVEARLIKATTRGCHQITSPYLGP